MIRIRRETVNTKGICRDRYFERREAPEWLDAQHQKKAIAQRAPQRIARLVAVAAAAMVATAAITVTAVMGRTPPTYRLIAPRQEAAAVGLVV